MKVTFSNIGQNNFLNIYRANRSIAIRNGNSGSLQSRKAEGRDIVIISPQGRNKSLLESLMKQKMNVTEQKKSLISKTFEQGGTLDSIKYQLETYDEQLKNIDRQITELMAKEMEKQAEKMEPKNDNKPKTEEEIQNERLASISSLSDDLQQAKTVSSVKARVDSDSRILKSEIKLDKAYADLSEGALKAKVAHKEAKLADMEQQSLRLTSKIADKLADISEEATNNSAPQEAVPETRNDKIKEGIER